MAVRVWGRRGKLVPDKQYPTCCAHPCRLPSPCLALQREAGYTDPYTDPVYQVQLDKIAAKAARDAAREEAAAAKAEK